MPIDFRQPVNDTSPQKKENQRTAEPVHRAHNYFYENPLKGFRWGLVPLRQPKKLQPIGEGRIRILVEAKNLRMP